MDADSMQNETDARIALQQVVDHKFIPAPTPASHIAPELGGEPAEPESPAAEAPRGNKQSGSAGKRSAKDGTVSSVYSGNRLRFLKKDDGEPLWRVDIQYLFLKYVFEDENKVFTMPSDGSPGHTFADIYIDTMAKSSKCSQILKEKLLTDRIGAVDMAMICLLVNVGRMNTTLNCKFFASSQLEHIFNECQSSLRCVPECVPITRSLPCKPSKAPRHTNSCKMDLVSSRY